MGVFLPDKPLPAAEVSARASTRPAPGVPRAPATPLAMRNRRMMRVLEQVTAALNAAGIPVMALKGAALQLTLYERPDQRPMEDLDLLIHAEDLPAARAVLERIGAIPGEPLVRPDFCPRFYYETEYAIGQIYPVKIDLHVRPFRPMRYARTVPDCALWERARPVAIGAAHLLVPSTEDMLIHLAAHSAIHGNRRIVWLRDIYLWAAQNRDRVDWGNFLATARDWRLALPVRKGIEAAARECGSLCPEWLSHALRDTATTWCDRLALWQAPRDAEHPVAHVLVNMLTTPGWRFTLAYFIAVAMPSREHLGDGYERRHWGWRQAAMLSRGVRPMIACLSLPSHRGARKSA